jgi:hypothetical protein
MAATYVQDQEAYVSSASETGISVTLDAAPTANNLLVAAVHVRSGDGISAITASGWSGASFEIVSGEASAVLYKVSDGTETTTTFSFTGGNGEPAAIVTEFSGLDSIAPFDGASSVASGSASSLTPSDVTPSSAPGLAHGGVSCSIGSSSRTLDTPAGYTFIESAGLTSAYNPLIRTAYKTYADTTAVSVTGTASGATELAVHLALFKEPTAGYTHPTLSAATLVPAGGNTYQPRVSYSFP